MLLDVRFYFCNWFYTHPSESNPFPEVLNILISVVKSSDTKILKESLKPFWNGVTQTFSNVFFLVTRNYRRLQATRSLPRPARSNWMTPPLVLKTMTRISSSGQRRIMLVEKPTKTSRRTARLQKATPTNAIARPRTIRSVMSHFMNHRTWGGQLTSKYVLFPS